MEMLKDKAAFKQNFKDCKRSRMKKPSWEFFILLDLDSDSGLESELIFLKTILSSFGEGTAATG